MAPLALALAACGRLWFDPIAGDGSAGGDGHRPIGDAIAISDAPMGVVGCVASGAEVCDGIDNDCNGVVDDGCPCTSFDRTLAVAKVPISPPAFVFAWTGNQYVVMIGGSTALSVMTIDAAGTASAEQTLIASGLTIPYAHAYAWNGHVLAFGYADGTAATLALYDPTAGALVGAPVALASTITAQEVRVRWVGDRFVVMWTDHTTFVKREVSPTGALLSGETIVTTLPNQQLQSFAVTPAGHLICVQPVQSASSTLYAVDANGTTTMTGVTFAQGFGCEIDPGPGAYVVSLTQALSQDNPFTLIDAAGNALATGTLPALVQPAEYIGAPTIATGTGYWIPATFVPDQTQLGKQVNAFETDAAGRIVVGPTPFTTFTTGANRNGVGVATDGRHTFAVLYDIAPQGMNPSHLYVGQHCP